MSVSTTPFTLFQGFEVYGNGVVRVRSLKYDVNALADFEMKTGMGFGQLFETKAVFATTRAMIWAGLKHEDRGLTLEHVGDLIFTWMKLNRATNTIDIVLQAGFRAAQEQGALGIAPETDQGGPDQGKALGDGNTFDTTATRVTDNQPAG